MTYTTDWSHTDADGNEYSGSDSYSVDEGWWEDHGEWVDKGWWDFFTDIYTAELTASSELSPNERNPTAIGKTFKSGYGVDNFINSRVRSIATTDHHTVAQTAVSYFPEFDYKTYWRLLELISRDSEVAKLEFRRSQYSAYNQRTHFTPLWYPDGKYNVYTYLFDAWTPDGMLSINLNDNMTIKGSVIDDSHFAPMR